MRAIQRKLLRDLTRLKGQVVTITLVMACGVASFVSLRGTFASIELARGRFYERQRFADVFAHLERAPLTLRGALERLPGVSRVELRVVATATVLLPDDPLPVPARLVSLPPQGAEILNAIALRDGRRPAPGHPGEVVALQQFADRNHLRPGDRIAAVVNGRRRDLRLVGTAMSPEYVMAIAAGGMAPDPARFAVLWVDAEALAAAFQMEGAFNHVSLELQPGASAAAAIDAVDKLLRRHGCDGAYGRDRQPSHRSLEGELAQLSSLLTVLPLVFLAVAALLVNVVLSRLVHLQQGEIAMLKAVGYRNREVGAHFAGLVVIIGGLGGAAGVALGGALGAALVNLYAGYFKLPDLAFRLDPGGAAAVAVISLAAAAAGAFGALRRAVRMPAAEAMRPEAPSRYRRTLVDRLGLARAVGPAAHMVVRELQRRPIRTSLSILAVAASTALAVVGGWYYDGIDELVETQFSLTMREDVMVSFTHARPERAVRELAHLPGVVAAEGLRLVPVRFAAGPRRRDGVLWGHGDVRMRELRDLDGRLVPLPPGGVVLTDVLARVLGVVPGDSVEVEILEGQRGTRSLPVTGVVSEPFGLGGHMAAQALRATLGEEPLATIALLRTDPRVASALDGRLKDTPLVVDVTRKAKLLERFREQSAGTILTMALIVSLFAAVITVGVVYNNARIALSMRSRDLASLRVLGFTRGEISAVLIGEMAVQVLVAVPLGLLLGHGLVLLLASTVDPETWRMPALLTARSYAWAATVTLGAALLSALVVRRRLDRLDLVAVLKARD